MTRWGFGATVAIALTVGLAIMVPRFSAALAAPDDDAEEESTVPSPTAGWFNDPDCRLVFFATLEGLYEDGIPTAVVDLIIGTDSKLSNKVKHNFVFQCELCHAVYEAFVLYQRRQTFNGSKVDTFKDGEVDPQLVKSLRSGNARTRVYAMGSLVQPWIKRKVLNLDMDDAGQRALMDRLHDLAKKGYALMDKHRRDDPEYGADWLFYDSCQACKAIKTVAEMLDDEK